MIRLRSATIAALPLAATLLMSLPSGAAQAGTAPASVRGASAPARPAGFRGQPVNPVTTRGATVRIIKLSPRACAEYNRTDPGTVPGCRAKLYSVNRTHLPLPGKAASASSYWYWTGSDAECSIYGCWYWEANLWMDGVANGSHVYQWHVGCTPSGYETYCGPGSNLWWGYFYNGGGWPNYAMQFGENSKSCVAPYNVGCFNHGQRQWVNDWGNFTTYYNW
jgi:hypothetical protein